MGMILLLPYFTIAVPNTVKLGVIYAISLMLIPHAQPLIANHVVMGIGLVGIIIKEFFIGFLLAFSASIGYWAVSFVGGLLDYQRGNFAMAAGIGDGGSSSPIGKFLAKLHSYYFFSSGAFLLLIISLYQSYTFWPVHTIFPEFEDGAARQLLSMLDTIMEIIIRIAGPLMIITLLVDLSLGISGRFAQQFNIFSLSIATKSLLLTIMLTLYVPYLVNQDLFTKINEKSPIEYLRGILRPTAEQQTNE
jgi:type III secretion protein T